MKTRPNGFLSEENISHDSEIFDYIKELHEYLWRFIRATNPGLSGDLGNLLDPVIEEFEFPGVHPISYSDIENTAREIIFETGRLPTDISPSPVQVQAMVTAYAKLLNRLYFRFCEEQ